MNAQAQASAANFALVSNALTELELALQGAADWTLADRKAHAEAVCNTVDEFEMMALRLPNTPKDRMLARQARMLIARARLLLPPSLERPVWVVWARKGAERVTLAGLTSAEAGSLWSTLSKDGWLALVCQ